MEKTKASNANKFDSSPRAKLKKNPAQKQMRKSSNLKKEELLKVKSNEFVPDIYLESPLKKKKRETESQHSPDRKVGFIGGEQHTDLTELEALVEIQEKKIACLLHINEQLKLQISALKGKNLSHLSQAQLDGLEYELTETLIAVQKEKLDKQLTEKSGSDKK